tara:strand:+ start:340 stop:555 length:216 start_codon:yes stop_codon:yes gene_type:complete
MDALTKQLIEDYNEIIEKDSCKTDLQRLHYKNEIDHLREKIESLSKENYKLKQLVEGLAPAKNLEMASICG